MAGLVDPGTVKSLLHTFDAPGWYLVSCTVLDDDGVSTTDWEPIYVVPEPNTLLLAAFALLAATQFRGVTCRFYQAAFRKTLGW